MPKSIVLLLLLLRLSGYGQITGHRIAGKYGDGVTTLDLKPDSTFTLKSPDEVFTYTYTNYQSSGVWTFANNTVILNPGKEKRKPQLSLRETSIKSQDSMRIKINYFVETYANERLISREPADFHLLTLYINKPAHYRNLVHTPIRRNCSFARRVRRQTLVDTNNILTLPRQEVTRIGVNSFGFGGAVELTNPDPSANYFEVTVIQSVDEDRTPRGKQVVVRKDCVYYYEWKGKVVSSGLEKHPLLRVD